MLPACAYGSNQRLAVHVHVRAGLLDAGIVHQFFLTVTHHGSIVLGFPANHMSGLLMFMPSYINQIKIVSVRPNYSALFFAYEQTINMVRTIVVTFTREIEKHGSYYYYY